MASDSTALTPLRAYEHVMRFAARCGEDALRLAMHAAVPQVLRPGLVHLLRLNFLPDSLDQAALEADVLFAPFCEALGNDYYRFDAEARLHLLRHLDPSYGADRVPRSQQVGRFLLSYLDAQLGAVSASHDGVYASYLEVERWVALAFFSAESAARQLAEAIRQTVAEDEAVAGLRITGLSAALEAPLAAHHRLLAYAAGVEALESGDNTRARDLLEPLGDEAVSLAGITLPAPRVVLAERLQDTGTSESEGEAPEGEAGPERSTSLEASGKGEPLTKLESRRSLLGILAARSRPLHDEPVVHQHEPTHSPPLGPRVFVSYSHDSKAHSDRVLELAARLRAEGVNAWLDRYVQSPPEGWIQWLAREVNEADFVLMVCTPTYRRRFEGEEAEGRGLGVNFEGATMQKLIYADGHRSEKFVPVLFEDTHNAVPLQLADRTRYQLPNDYEALYRRLTAKREFWFDVFLSHVSNDKPVVRELGLKLRARGLRVWLDEWEVRPGTPWQEELENAIQTVRGAAILYGPSGIGPWADREIHAFLSEFVERKAPVIPVLLPGAPRSPKLPLFLKTFTWVDLRGGLTPSGLDRLVQGLTVLEHTADFRSCRYGTQAYSFTATQARIVEALYEAWCRNTPAVSQDYLLERSGSLALRLLDVFRSNPAWRTLILPGKRKGTYQLALPPRA
jgi:hypothetical protein